MRRIISEIFLYATIGCTLAVSTREHSGASGTEEGPATAMIVRWQGALREAFGEACHYIAGSPHSRLRQLEALRQLDDRLLADIGLTREEARLGRLIDSARADGP
jgi:uncharacterized protein YjiS (DUF1127 family)